MQTIKILPHTSNTTYNQPHFFIQSKGYNAGRPSTTSYSISYVVLVNDEIEKGMLFWICFGLWKTNRFLPLLQGSTACILNPQDASKLIDDTCRKLYPRPGEFLSNVKELKQLIQTENLLDAQLKMIKQLKKSIAKQMLR